MVELNLFLSLADTEFMIPGISVLKHENLLRNQKIIYVQWFEQSG